MYQFLGQEFVKMVSIVSGPVTDVMGQFLGRENDIIYERSFMKITLMYDSTTVWYYNQMTVLSFQSVTTL